MKNVVMSNWVRHMSIAAATVMTAGMFLFLVAAASSASMSSPLANELTSPASESRGRDVTSGNGRVPLRLLPLGDSITRSDINHLSYRYSLWTKMVDAGIDFEFVGSLDSNFGGNGAWKAHKGKSFDSKHEGHWGWRADQILEGVSGAEGGRLSEWLNTYTPDIVLMHLGTNDLMQSQSASSTVHELERIIEVLRADNPKVVILVAKLIPTYNAGVNSRIAMLNSRLERIAAKASTAASPIIVVDQNSGFDVSADTYDWIHPNRSGEEKIAAKWFDALQDVLGNGYVNRTTTASAREIPAQDKPAT